MAARILGLAGAIFLFSVIYLYVWYLLCDEEWMENFFSKSRWRHLLNPNLITILSFFICIFGLWLYYYRQYYAFGIFVYAFGAFLDIADGALAKRTKQITGFGIWIDPIRDKLVYFSGLFMFYLFGDISLIPLVIFFAADVLFNQFFIRYLLAKHGYSVAAVRIGKNKTFFVFGLLALLGVIHGLYRIPGLDYACLITASFLSIASGIKKLPENTQFKISAALHRIGSVF